MAYSPPADLSDYLALARACRTQNQFNRLHIKIDEDCSPEEMAEIGARETDAYPAESRAWLAALREREPGMFDAPRPFDRRVLADRVTLYEGRGAPRGAKTLLIGFSGVTRRLMLPPSFILQALDAGAWDLLLLKRTKSFLAGMDGVAPDFDGLLRYLETEIGVARYGRAVSLGVSGGGAPAVIAAMRMGLPRGVSICGVAAQETLDLQPRRSRVSRLFRRGPSLCFAYGADFPPDRDAALAMSAAWGGHRRPVAKAKRHNVLKFLHSRGRLGDFLKEVL